MASKEAKSPESAPAKPADGAGVASPKESKKKAKDDVETFAFEFKLLKDKIGDKTTNKQVKAKVAEAFMGYGAFDESRVTGDVGADRTVVVFFARLFGKGQPTWDSLVKGEKPKIKIYDEDVELSQTDEKPSGGGAATGTAHKPKKEAEGKKKGGPKKEGGRGGGRGDEKGDGKGDSKDKDGDRKDGGRGRGRGKKEEPKVSMQRGRANIGGKLGPVSKVRLAKIEKAKRDKENAERIAHGEAPIEEKKEEAPPEEKKEPKKEEKGKKGGDAKKEGGKAEAGKKGGDAKKEAGKAEAKKEGAKKGK